ncbi:SAM-dependent methyltransferase [Desulfosarcina widdelii]|uniref:SAM-dependent methyltransferase n=1 Tax=Desulfosarcina widdelii TaxID=947919 RepID=A0A5K7ZI07_9BACT|nr:class I SAM-dependent methyltransferase [Desulfosarcina widdelii]BBO75707.1 SAM-dependent methyltransferase [Desulfosarcina widdelii]
MRPYESETVRAVTGTTIRPGGLALTRRAAEVCGLGPGDRVMDVGCGTGATASCLHSEYGTAVIGMDLSPVLLDEAILQHSGMNLIRANAMDLPFQSGGFDAVFAECVCSLLPDSVSALDGFHRVLKPGGHLVVADLYWRACDRTAMQPKASLGGCLAGAVDRRTLVRRIENAGFDIDVWEDHSEALKQLAAQLVWAGISLTDWWGVDCFSGACNNDRRPGYCLMIAHKKENPNG